MAVSMLSLVPRILLGGTLTGNAPTVHIGNIAYASDHTSAVHAAHRRRYTYPVVTAGVAVDTTVGTVVAAAAEVHQTSGISEIHDPEDGIVEVSEASDCYSVPHHLALGASLQNSFMVASPFPQELQRHAPSTAPAP